MAIGDAPTTPRGFVSDSVALQSNGFSVMLEDFLETVPDLVWPLNIQTYARMRTDPQLAAVLSAMTLPLRRAALWAVDPAGCRAEVAQLVADDLGLPLLGAEDEPGAARRRGVRWSEHLRLALLHLVFGHMPFETVYEIRDGRARLAMLSERMPSSITQIEVNSDGTLSGFRQGGPNSPLIDSGRLAWYAHDREGANWAGRSVLRPAFGPWLLKHEMWRVHATSNRRWGMGVPAVSAPAGATPAQLAEAQRLASAMRAGDQAGMGLPNGFSVDLKGITGSVPDTLAFVRYLDQQMSRMVLAGMLDLGETPNGSRALGSEFIDLFLLSLESVADDVADVATGLSVRSVDFNWGEDEPAPRICVSEVGSRHDVTAEALNQLLSSAAITPDEELEAFIRGRWRLPQRTTPRPAPPSPQPPGFGGAPAPGPDSSASARVRAARRRRRLAAVPRAAAVTLRREPTAQEKASRADFVAIQNAWQDTRDNLVADWARITRAQRKELADQITAAVDDDDLQALSALAVDSTDGAALLLARMDELAEEGANEQADEATAQGVEGADVPEDIDPDNYMDETAAAVAALLAGSLAQTAGRRAVQVHQPGASGEEVAAAVDTYLAGLTDSFLRDQLGGALSSAQMFGRMNVLGSAPAADIYVASELLDASTCEECSRVDGTEYGSLDEAKAAYASGGYIECDGGSRCRGLLLAVWDEAAVQQPAAKRTPRRRRVPKVPAGQLTIDGA